MTDNFKSTLTISSSAEFEDALTAVIETAVSEDIDIRGAWECRNGDSHDDWEITITRLAKRLEDDSEHAESR